MSRETMAARAARYLHTLCLEIPTRRLGSAGNRAATRFAAEVLAAQGWEVSCPEFACLDWEQAGARLEAGGVSFDVQVGPYSPGCRLRAPLSVVSDLETLAAATVAGHILLVRGALAQEQLMPKNFPFYNPDAHRQTIALLEQKRPAAVVAATGRNPDLAGGLYPFPLIEDGDFDIPSLYMTDVAGERLADHAGAAVFLELNARRRPATGCNVIARRPEQPGRRLVACAHIDSKDGTPGALDNAAGVVVLLLLAEMLPARLAPTGGAATGLEIVAFNGEDHYSAAGQLAYLAEHRDALDQIALVVNLDGVGYRHGQHAYSLYGVPDPLAAAVQDVLARQPDLVPGPSWVQGDHMIFVPRGVPAVALTSTEMAALWTEIAHTPADRPELVDPARLVDLAHALRDLWHRLQAWPAPGVS